MFFLSCLFPSLTWCVLVGTTLIPDTIWFIQWRLQKLLWRSRIFLPSLPNASERIKAEHFAPGSRCVMRSIVEEPNEDFVIIHIQTCEGSKVQNRGCGSYFQSECDWTDRVFAIQSRNEPWLILSFFLLVDTPSPRTLASPIPVPPSQRPSFFHLTNRWFSGPPSGTTTQGEPRLISQFSNQTQYLPSGSYKWRSLESPSRRIRTNLRTIFLQITIPVK